MKNPHIKQKWLVIKTNSLIWRQHLKTWAFLMLRVLVSVSLVGLMTSCAGILDRPVVTVHTTKIYHPPVQTKPSKQKINGLVITPQVAVGLSELCDESKGVRDIEAGDLVDEDAAGDLVDEDAAGDPDYCAWVLMAFPKGDWSKFKTWLLDFEAYAKRLSFDLKYYRGVTKEIEDYGK